MVDCRAMRLSCLLLFVAFVLFSASARAEDSHKAECAAAYEKSQEFRAQNKLRKAEELLKVCAEASCPTFVQTDCSQWLTEVQKDLPSIVIVAKDKEGADVTAVKVSIDGEVVATELDGKSISIEPGRHRLRFEIEGAPPVEQPIIAKQGEKDREVKVSFRQAEAEEASNPYPAHKDEGEQAPPAEEEKPKSPNKLRLYSYIAGGVGAAGIIGFGVFAIMGKSQQSDLESRGCAPNCPKDETDAAKTKLLIANISLGVGIAGLGTGVVLFILSQPKADKPANDEALRRPRLDLGALPGGGYATVSSRF